MEKMEELISEVNGVVWGPIMLALLIGTGLFLSIATGFPQFRRFSYAVKNTVGSLFSKNQHSKDESGVSPFQAVATAMAGTIGTGSIAGIATAIVSGGPGAVFWMWVSALLGMVTKYAEIVLSLRYREKNRDGQWVGGPMYYLKNGLGAKWLAAAFCLFCIAACLGTGNATQSNSIAVALESTIGVAPWITGVILTVLVAAVILGGVRRIATVNEKMVPFMAAVYVFCALAAVVLNFEKVPEAFGLIFREAFNFRAAAGGVAGYGVLTAMRFGFAKGVFSNEAGLGSAPIAHASSSTKDPVKQGLWGLFEVFFTTVIICTMSALAILTAGLWDTGAYQGSALCIASFNTILPGLGGIGVTLSTVFFALSTILGWAYYGEVSIGFLAGQSHAAVPVYRLVYVAFVFIGAVGSLDVVWGVSETMNGLMAIPNLIGLLGLWKVVRDATREHFEGK